MSDKSTLKPPVSYQGGKQRLSKEIIDIIFEDNFIDENTKFYDLCSGSGAISLELVNRGISSNNITMVDAGVYGYFWQLLANGQFSYKDFKEEVNKIPTNKDEVKQYMERLITEPVQDIESMVYRFLLLQAGSFGGKQISIDNKNQKWNPTSFRNYWKPTPTSNRKSPVNPMQPMPDTILQRVKKLINAELIFKVFVTDIYNILEDFTNYNSNTIIYIDPPYSNLKYMYIDDVDFPTMYNDILWYLKNSKAKIMMIIGDGDGEKEFFKEFISSEYNHNYDFYGKSNQLRKHLLVKNY